MSAIVCRINPDLLSSKSPSVQVEFLKRDEALFAALEWNWTTEREAAHEFLDYATAEQWISITRKAEKACGENRFFGAYPSTVASSAPTSSSSSSPAQPAKEAPQSPAFGAAAPKREKPADKPAAPKKGIAPAEAAKGGITERIHTAKHNKRVAAERKENGAEAWKNIFTTRISPQECFEETGRRLGEHE